jgi:hypothetical protein
MESDPSVAVAVLRLPQDDRVAVRRAPASSG